MRDLVPIWNKLNPIKGRKTKDKFLSLGFYFLIILGIEWLCGLLKDRMLDS